MSDLVRRRPIRAAAAIALTAALPVLAGCAVGPPPATPPIVPGTSTAPREVNIVMKDYVFLPDPVDIAPGETVLLHVVNGGLIIHEAVIGDQAVQDAWEVAEAAAAGAPPGPTPVVSVAPDLSGVRIVVPSGQRVDYVWTASTDPSALNGLILGCHVPGHWAAGMRASIRVATVRG